MTGILSHLSKSSINTTLQQCASEMYWETYLSEKTNTQTVISLKTWGFGQNGIDITWNNDKKVKLVKQL